jgi:AcrR family transcriptional regulator
MEQRRKNQANLLVRECMTTALMQLLKEKPLYDISISELTEKAGVSRMAYYRNYKSKEDIFSLYMEDIINDYKEDRKTYTCQGIYYDTTNLIHCFSYFKKYQNYLESLFQSGLSHVLLNAISNYMTETWLKPEDNIEHFYTLQAFTGSLFNLYISWTLHGAKETPEEMAQILHQIYCQS